MSSELYIRTSYILHKTPAITKRLGRRMILNTVLDCLVYWRSIKQGDGEVIDLSIACETMHGYASYSRHKFLKKMKERL